MGRIVLWILSLSVSFMPGGGLKCMSCNKVEYLDECPNDVTTCAEDSNCSKNPLYYGIPWGFTATQTCCDNGDLCVLTLPAFIAATFPPKVTHLHPPLIIGNTTLPFQSRHSIYCRNNATRSVSTTWLFNGGSKFPPHASYSNGSYTLDILEMTSSEVGNYTCIISKDGMTAQTSVWISLQEKPLVTSVKTSITHRPPINGHVRIICTATGYPVPTVLWSFRDAMGVYNVPQDVSYPTPNMVDIWNFQPALHSGTWTCMARNSRGADQMSIEL